MRSKDAKKNEARTTPHPCVGVFKFPVVGTFACDLGVGLDEFKKNSFCGQTVHNPLFSRIFIRALKNREAVNIIVRLGSDIIIHQAIVKL